MKFPSKQEALYQTMHNANPLYRNHNQGISRLRQWLYQLKDPPASILEIGCGNGKLCELLDMMGYDVVGMDIVPGPYDRKGYNFVLHDITLGRLPFKDDEFDYCISFDVLEHLPKKWISETVWDMARVSTEGIIGTAACFERCGLHLTVEEPKWWMEQLSQSCTSEVEYQIVGSPAGKTVLFYTKKEN